MTSPRQILRGATYLISRRCSERRNFLLPSEDINDLLLYVLAASTERFGILIHAYCFLSNHFHLVLTDPQGLLPQFQQYLCSLIARSCNGLRGHWESFWAPGSYSAVRLLEERDVVDKIAYTLVNPVAAGLVRSGGDWPGLRSTPGAIGGRALVVPRPEHFFRAEGRMPAAATLALVAPPGVESVEGFRDAVRAEVKRQEDEAIQRIVSSGKTFLGVRRILAQSVSASPAGSEPRRGLNPRIACLDKDKRMQALEMLKEFVAAYRDAWHDFASGLRETIFPHGTYWMRVAYRVECAPAG